MEKEILATSENGKIQYQLLTPKYLDAACEVIKTTLFMGGILSKAIGLPNDLDALEEMNQFSRIVAKDGVSVIAVDKIENKVVGVAFNKIFLPPVENFYNTLAKSFKNHRSLQLIDFITTIENFSNLFEHCQVDCLMEILLLGVDPDYRKIRIGTKLCEISIEIAQKLMDGVNVKHSTDGQELSLEPVPKAVTAMFNSPGSQKIGRQLDFTIAAERYSDKVELLGTTIDTGKFRATLQYKKLYRN